MTKQTRKETYLALMIFAGTFLVWLIIGCATPESILRQSILTEARHEARLQRIKADTLARPIQNYSDGVLLNGWVPRYNNNSNGYWYNGAYYSNGFYRSRPLIRLNSNRYVVPYKKRRTKTRRNGTNNNRRSNIVRHPVRKNNKVKARSRTSGHTLSRTRKN